MNISIQATEIELTPKIKSYVDKKIGSVSKYFGKKEGELLAEVEVEKVTRHHQNGEIHRAEVHITGAGLDLYADSTQEDIFAAIDAVRDEIVREIKKSRGKEETLSRRGGAIVKNMAKGFYWKMSNFRKKK